MKGSVKSRQSLLDNSMVEIYICEDNLKQLGLFTKYVNNTILIENLDMRVVKATPNPHEILENLLSTDNIGLFFLDIDLNADINGLMLAQQIRKIQPRCFIIFITSHSEMSYLTFQYKVEALDFIVKDTAAHIKVKIHECILNVNEKYISVNNTVNKVFTINQSEKVVSIDYSDIMFFETSSNIHKILLHADKRMIEFSGQLKDLEPKLDWRFYRCHRSFFVNTKNISHVDFNQLEIHMNNNEVCPVSIRAKKGLKKILT